MARRRAAVTGHGDPVAMGGEEGRTDAGEAGTQDGPALAQNDATVQQQVDGIIEQVRADLGTATAKRYEEVLRQRFSDADLEIPTDQVHALAERLAGGPHSTAFAD